MSYKMERPMCAGCFFQMKNNKELVDEIFRRSEEEVWGTGTDSRSGSAASSEVVDL